MLTRPTAIGNPNPIPQMNTLLRITIVTAAASAWSFADLPRKMPLGSYSNLWQNSPFTSKPPPPEEAPAANPLEDYALGGVSPIDGGYRVTLLNKTNPEERLYVFSDDPNPKHGFKIVGVTRKEGDVRGTVVSLTSGAGTGTVAYEESLLQLVAPPPPPPPQPQQQVQPGQAPPTPPGQAPQRQPRPRVVPPPTPGQQPQVQPQVQPQAQPQPQQVPQVNPAHQRGSGGERSDRRGRR